MDSNMLRVLLTCRDLCFSLPPREPVFRQAKRNSSEMNSHRVGSGLDFPEDFLHLRVSVLLLTTEGNTRNEIRHFPAENYSLSQIDRHRERMDFGRREKRRLMFFFFKGIVYPKMKSNLMSFQTCITFFLLCKRRNSKHCFLLLAITINTILQKQCKKHHAIGHIPFSASLPKSYNSFLWERDHYLALFLAYSWRK